MTVQCVGPSLDVDDANVLDVRLAGAPPEAALPSTGTGARLDPARGVWTPAEHNALQIYAARNDSEGGLVVNPGSTHRADVLSVTVTNPSASRQMLALVNFHAKIVTAIAQATTAHPYSGWGFLFGFDVDADPGSAVAVVPVIVRRDMGVTSGEKGFTHSHMDSTHVLLAPGQTRTLRLQVALSAYDEGYVRYTESWHSIRGLGVTL